MKPGQLGDGGEGAAKQEKSGEYRNGGEGRELLAKGIFICASTSGGEK